MKKFSLLIIIVFFTNISFSQDLLIKEILSGKTKKYCTQDNVKANGLNLCIKYPESWIERDGNRPHVLVKLRGQARPEMVIILIFPLEKELTSREQAEGLKESDLISMAKDGAGTYLGGNTDIKIDGIKGAYFDMKYTNQVMDKKIEGYSRIYLLFYKKYFIQIQCSVNNDESNSFSIPNMKSYFESYIKIFELIVNSITIVNQWE